VNVHEEHTPSPSIRASDAERYHADAQLQQHYMLGRLTLAELEERTTMAHEARTRAQLDALLTDLPNDAMDLSSEAENLSSKAPVPASYMHGVDTRLLIILLCIHPPAALVYWLIARRTVRRTA
jgi:hypothetical protein